MHQHDPLRPHCSEFNTATQTTTPRILCVDSDTEFTAHYFEQLRKSGCDVFTCFLGQLAKRAATAFRPEICVINLKLPDLPGNVIAKHVQSQVEKSPLYLIAIIPDTEQLEQIADQLCEFHAFLVAPFKPQDLLQLVDSWLLRRAKFQYELAMKARFYQPNRSHLRLMTAV